MFKPKINKHKDMEYLDQRAPIHKRVEKILKNKNENIEAISAVAKEARKDYMKKNMGMDTDEDILE